MKKYYNNIECEVVAELPNNESVIRFITGTYHDEEEYYSEPIETSLVVSNKYLTCEPIEKSTIIKEKELMLNEISSLKNQKIKEANQQIRNEKQELITEIKELKEKLENFNGLNEFYKFVNNEYKFFFSKSGIGKFKIVSKEELLEYKDGRDTREKAIGFKYVHVLDKQTQKYKGKYEIAMEVYHYSDGSGGATYIKGFSTLDEAIQAYKEYLNANININNYDVETCNRYHVVNEKVINYEVTMKNKQKENNQKEILRLKANIERLEKETK